MRNSKVLTCDIAVTRRQLQSSQQAVISTEAQRAKWRNPQLLPPRARDQFPIAHDSSAIQIRRSFSSPTRCHAERKRSICGCSCHSSRGLVFHLHYGNAQPYPQLAASRPREQENSSGLALTVRVQSPEFFMGGVLGDQVGRVLRVARESVCRNRFWANTPANRNTKPFGCPDGRVKARYSRK